jgi:CRP-like cAMP-binding protein
MIRNMLHSVAQSNLQLNQKIEILSKRTTREKVMAYLLSEAKIQGSDDFTIPYDRQELADFLGVERSAMSAVIGKLRDEGYIKVNRRHFQLIR